MAAGAVLPRLLHWSTKSWCADSGLSFGVQGLGFGVQGRWLRVQGSGFGVQGLRCMSSGFRVKVRNLIVEPDLDPLVIRRDLRTRDAIQNI